MGSICGANCDNCGFGKNNGCRGCENTGGCPFGKQCFVAQYIKISGKRYYDVFLQELIEEINSLKIPGMPEIKELLPINGVYINFAYTLPNGESVKFLCDNDIYLATQVECEFNTDGEIMRCFGIAANTQFILVSEYGMNGSDPELILFYKR